jgi:hypothetical protein
MTKDKSLQKLQYEDILNNLRMCSSRQIAYKDIYLKNKEDYSLPFESYVIHHKDRDEDNNGINNLDIITRDEHEQIHGFGLGGKKELCEFKKSWWYC